MQTIDLNRHLNQYLGNYNPRKHGLEFTLLSDLDREVVESYDVKFVGLGGIEGYVSANRAVVIIDGDGKIVHRWIAENPGVEPNYDEIVAFVSNL